MRDLLGPPPTPRGSFTNMNSNNSTMGSLLNTQIHLRDPSLKPLRWASGSKLGRPEGATLSHDMDATPQLRVHGGDQAGEGRH